MLYTRKGDMGTTKTFHCDQRVTKGSLLADALGTVDELNVWLGFTKAKLVNANISYKDTKLSKIINDIQQTLFIIQAELAGAEGKTVTKEQVSSLENIIDGIEKELPEISSFFVPGATELSAICEYGRVVSRRAEREVIKAVDDKQTHVSEETKAYLNRLSSILYAFTRFINHVSDINEEAPHY